MLNAPLCNVSWWVLLSRPCQYGIVGAGGVGMIIQRTCMHFHKGQPFHSIKGGAECADANVELRMDAKLVHGLSTVGLFSHAMFSRLACGPLGLHASLFVYHRVQLGEARCSFMHHIHAHACVHLHARLHTHVHTAHSRAYMHSLARMFAHACA